MDVSDWLRTALRENDVNVVVLPSLTAEDLKDLGVTVGHRRRLLEAIAALRRDAPPAVEPIQAQRSPLGGVSDNG